MRRPTQPHEQLEHELAQLLEYQEKGEISSGGEPPISGKGDDLKKRVRVIKNRLAAKKSREQARSYVQELEGALSALTAKNEDLARRLAQVEAENDALRRESKAVTGRSGSTGSTGSKNHINTGEPAALTQTSLQLDVVLLSLALLAAASPSLPSPVGGPPSASSEAPQNLGDVLQAVAARLPALTRGRVRRSRRALRRAGQLRCIAHLCRRIQSTRSAS